MSSLRRRRRIHLLIAAAGLLVAASVTLGFALREGISYFMTPSEIIARPDAARSVRLGGLVKPGSLIRSGDHLTFTLTDGDSEIEVRFKGLPPDLFGEGVGAIARGRLHGVVFEADEIVARHDETYVPRELERALPEPAAQ